jgi:hypothetical protein
VGKREEVVRKEGGAGGGGGSWTRKAGGVGKGMKDGGRKQDISNPEKRI